ncbi:hypothetical protein [Desulfogranum marinum]|uniref:hypothetical protein n=1 Tax=Desulfogranum marinum TaxID=453220 RepID=UPI0029C8AE49|nr:hypothetical protein [Desulfogranum marinum]
MSRNVDKVPTVPEEYTEEQVSFDRSAEVDHKRRKIVRKIAVGSTALACCSVIPDKWTTPLVEFGSLPAHATTSGLEATLQAAVEDVEAEIERVTGADEAAEEEPESSNSETISRTGPIYIDGVIRSKFVSDKLGPQYGPSLKIVFDSGEVLYVPDTKKDVNQGGMGYRPGGNYTYHKDVHKMEVYAKPGSSARSITIYY